MSHRPTFDVGSFQKLLEAAYVLQCEREKEQAQRGPEPAFIVTNPAEVGDPESIAKPELDLIPVAALAPVIPVPEIAGALALAADEVDAEQAAEPAVATDFVRKPPAHAFYSALRAASRRSANPIVRTHRTRTAVVIRFKRPSRPAIAYAGPLAAMIVVLALLLYLLGHHPPDVTSVSAASKPAEVSPAGKDPSLLEASHLRVTDPDTSANLGSLSRFEIQSLRRKAEFGDDGAALTLGMAYETGDQVRQSCADAAHWIGVAAEDGNAAAQYNLGLRYSEGDGIPKDFDEAQKWLKKAASQGYEKARQALLASRS